MSLLFINYRVKEQPLMAKYLYNRLARRFGRALVYRDDDDLRGGEQYPQSIWSALGKAEVLLVVIGPSWLELRENGVRLIDRPRDWVRREIERAIELRIQIIPVVLDGAAPPRVEQVPPSIRLLATAQAMPMRAGEFEKDVANLVKRIAELRTRSGPTIGQVAARHRFTLASVVAVPVLVVVGVTLALWRGDGPWADPPANGGGGVLWHGDIAPQNGGVDLDQLPPGRGDGADVVIDLLSQVDPGPHGKIAISDGARAPGKAECVSLLDGVAEGVPAFEPAAGDMLCVETDKGRFAVAEYRTPDRNGVFRLPATVWS
ncbi:toll/interleukin-1 receptor domain-containing protein [Actinophytocola sp.]|uniref:toll/interleukin-1 receptor domain-containing protein n=1 Tax=Actinophytocola sp. TaxID=1872138 RepID=UPI00389A15F2